MIIFLWFGYLFSLGVYAVIAKDEQKRKKFWHCAVLIVLWPAFLGVVTAILISEEEGGGR